MHQGRVIGSQYLLKHRHGRFEDHNHNNNNITTKPAKVHLQVLSMISSRLLRFPKILRLDSFLAEQLQYGRQRGQARVRFEHMSKGTAGWNPDNLHSNQGEDHHQD